MKFLLVVLLLTAVLVSNVAAFNLISAASRAVSPDLCTTDAECIRPYNVGAGCFCMLLRKEKIGQCECMGLGP